MPLQLPSRYQVGRELGRGGMGIVYEADDERLGRKVAVKVLHAGQASEERKRRFAQEARAASALNHPNIITIHDIDAHDGVDFIVMELVDGVAADARRPPDGPLPLDRVLDYARQIAGALAASHAANIVHRDIKPANIMVTAAGDIKVLDFGLSKWTAHRRRRGADRRSVHPDRYGRRHQRYMAPEQALGQPIDARSDVFSFGVVLYELLAGRRAFDGDSDLAVTTAVVRDGPKPLSEIRSDLPEALRADRRSLPRKRSHAPLSLGGRGARGSAAADAGERAGPAGGDGAIRGRGRHRASRNRARQAPGSRSAAGRRRPWSSVRCRKSNGCLRPAATSTPTVSPGARRARRRAMRACKARSTRRRCRSTVMEPAGADVFFKDYFVTGRCLAARRTRSHQGRARAGGSAALEDRQGRLRRG